ncbi:MAG: T9SS type A sorting domain-containing protein [Crocinitomicaceae bacterium]
MKRLPILTFSALCLFSLHESTAQTILFEDFNSCSVPSGWASSTNGQGWEIGTTTALSGGSLTIPSKGSCVAVLNDSETAGNDANNDFLVSPMFDITGITALNFNFNVFIPETGSYMNIQYSKDSVNWSTVWSGLYEMQTAGWENKEVTAGQQFFTGGTERWIRLSYKDYNVNTIGVAVDDLHLFVPDDNDLKLVAIRRNEWSLLNENQDIKGGVFNNGLNTISSFDLNWQLDAGTINTENFSFNLAPTYTNYIEQLDAYALNTTGEHELKIWVSNPNGMTDSNPNNDTITMTVNGANWLPEKRVLLEKFTHTECSPCVAGDEHLEIMLDDHPFVTGVSIHAAGTDPYTIPDGDELDNTYIIAHPAFMADRKLLYTNVGWFGYDIDQYLGETDDLDLAGSDEQAASVEIEKVSFDEGTRELQFDVVATFYGDYSSEMGINAYIMEDSVIGYQVAAPDPNNYPHNHVLREMLGGTWGNDFNMSDVNTTDNTYRETFVYTIPSGYDEDQITFLGLIQKQHSSIHKRDIINCTPAYHIDEGITLAVNKDNINELKVYPNPANNAVFISIPQTAVGSTTVQIKDLSGKTIYTLETASKSLLKVNIEDFTKGIYLVELTDSHHQRFIQKLIVQ